MQRRDDDQPQWAIEAIRIAPVQHRGWLAIVVLAFLGLLFLSAWMGGAAGAHHHDEED